MLRILAVTVFSLLLVVVSGCVPNRAYRTGIGHQPAPVQLAATSEGEHLQVENSSTRPCPKEVDPRYPAPEFKDHEPSKGNYDLAFIEFDDMGEFWTIGNLCATKDLPDNSQLARALALIKMRKAEMQDNKPKPVFVITFIHGWKNNASENNERENREKNLAGFKETLKALASQDTQHHYIGVFVAWRGQVLAGDLFASYWNRRDAANRIAGPSMTEALFKLMYATRPDAALEDPCPSKDSPAGNSHFDAPRDDSHFVIVGHSLGGRILERAVAQPYLAMLVERVARMQAECGTLGATSPSRGFRPPADLIVFLNPANDSFEGKAMIEGMIRLNITAEPKGPLFLSISSQKDLATRTAMPIAQWITLAGKAKTRKDYGHEAAERGQFSRKPQSYYFNNSEANVEEMRTHEIKLESEEPCPPASPNGVTVDGKCYVFHSLKTESDKAPFWVISEYGSVITNHWDIFERPVQDLLAGIILQSINKSIVIHPAGQSSWITLPLQNQ